MSGETPGLTESEERRSFCRFCGSFCAVIATVKGEQIVDVRGDPDDPVSRGYICTKGRALGRFHHHPLRLNRPRMRRDGARVDTDWDVALDDMAEKLLRLIDEHGPAAIGAYAGTPAVPCASLNIWRTFMTALGTLQIYSTVSVDVPCAPLVAERICGNPMVSSQPDPDARMTVLVGVNPMVSHGHVFFMPAPKRQLRRWADHGELWVIDPRRSETAEVATRHLAPWPGSEFLLLGHAVRELLRDGADAAFLETRVRGVETLRAAVERFTLEETAAGTRLPPNDIAAFVAAIRKAGRVGVHCGTGISMARNANAATFLTWALHAVTGSLDRRGGAYFNPGFVRNLDRHGWEPVNTTAPGPPSRPDLPARLGEYPCAAIVDEIEAGNLKALFCFAGNPLIALPDAGRLKAALAKLDLLVMIDVVETASTGFATHLLPSGGQLEMADLVTFDFMNPAEYTRYASPIVPLRGERRPLWRILQDLAGRLGIDLGERIESDDDLLRPMMAGARAGFEEARAANGALASQGRTYEWAHEHLPGGRWNLAPDDLIEQLKTACIDASDLVLIPHRQKHKLNGQMSDGLANPRRPDRAALSINPEDAAERKVCDGDIVIISTATGRVEAPARLDARLRRGVVSLPHGFGDMNVNMLTDARNTDPLSGMVTLGAFPVCVIRRDAA